MAFKKATSPLQARIDNLLSADNAIPERHIVIETVRTAAPRLGLTSSVITTLDAMLSCMAPKRNHHTVFASNATLSFRRNGISDRTIRRHAALLYDAGLLIRNDSANGKRFTKHSKNEGKALRFGFDLTPLYDRLHEIAAMAADVLKEQEQLSYLRAKIRAAVNVILSNTPSDKTAHSILLALRRKLSVRDCEKILETFTPTDTPTETAPDDIESETKIMSVKDGQIVRHHHSSNKEHIDKKKETTDHYNQPTVQNLTVSELIEACPEAAQYSYEPIKTALDVVSLARTLAPMIGIPSKSYDEADKKLGAFKAASTLWAIMQSQNRIKAAGAYFYAITVGSRSANFSPEDMVRRLAKQKLSADNRAGR
ncbi:plasmid replication protein RepC [Roseobacter sp.]|uniref:plasmid replication protein RepC n=1 Tax=Roseobacter sp. TaxID=1907202 RepID=UPI003299EF6A